MGFLRSATSGRRAGELPAIHSEVEGGLEAYWLPECNLPHLCFLKTKCSHSLVCSLLSLAP